MNAELFTCPICKELMLDKIYQCKTGHLFCPTCIAKIDKCALCNINIPDKTIRSITIEQLREFVELPCGNCGVMTTKHKEHKLKCKFNKCRNEGCNTIGSERAMYHHKFICAHRILECIVSDCKKEFPFHQMKQHVINHHDEIKFNQIRLEYDCKMQIPEKDGEIVTFYELLNDDFIAVRVVRKKDKLKSDISIVAGRNYKLVNLVRYGHIINGSMSILPISPFTKYSTEAQIEGIIFTKQTSYTGVCYPEDPIEVTICIHPKLITELD